MKHCISFKKLGGVKLSNTNANIVARRTWQIRCAALLSAHVFWTNVQLVRDMCSDFNQENVGEFLASVVS